MKKENYGMIDFGMLAPYREKRTEVIFKSKKIDGQKDKKTNGEINKEIFELEKKQNRLLSQYLLDAEKYNINPKLVSIQSIPDTWLYSFDLIQTKPQYDEFYFEGNDELLKCISNNNEYIEKTYLEKLKEKWFTDNNKIYPKKRKKISLFYNIDFASIFHVQKTDLLNGNIVNIEFYKYSKIYCYWKNSRSDAKRFLKIQKKFISQYNSFNIQKAKLHEEERFSNRGDVWIDYEYFYKINGQDVYEFASKFFWEFNDEYLKLQENNPELFGKGYKSILEGLHRLFLNKYPNEQNYWGSFNDFVLKIQQQYFYIANSTKSLRLDLFRNLLNDGTFEGGLWHSFQHFKINGKPLSAKYKGGVEFYESYFFDKIREAFFCANWEIRTEKKDGKIEYEVKVDELGNLNKIRVIGLFYDPNKDLHSLKSVMIKDKQK